MALKRNIYKALEDILGPENVSDDFVVTGTYARTSMPVGPRFEAVALPKNTKKSRQSSSSVGSPTEFSTLPVDYGYSLPTRTSRLACLGVALRYPNSLSRGYIDMVCLSTVSQGVRMFRYYCSHTRSGVRSSPRSCSGEEF